MGRLSNTLRRTALADGAPGDWNRRRSYDWSTFSDRSVFHRLGSSAYSPKGPVTHSENLRSCEQRRYDGIRSQKSGVWTHITGSFDTIERMTLR